MKMRPNESQLSRLRRTHIITHELELRMQVKTRHHSLVQRVFVPFDQRSENERIWKVLGPGSRKYLEITAKYQLNAI